jgi:hypothetical protein
MSQICISDSDDSDVFEWDTDGEAEPSSVASLRNFDAPGPSTLVRRVVYDIKACHLAYELHLAIIMIMMWCHVTV